MLGHVSRTLYLPLPFTKHYHSGYVPGLLYAISHFALLTPTPFPLRTKMLSFTEIETVDFEFVLLRVGAVRALRQDPR